MFMKGCFMPNTSASACTDLCTCVADSARVLMEECCFWRGQLQVEGPGSVAVADSCQLRESWGSDLLAQGRAAVKLHKCTIEDSLGFAARVTGACSLLQMQSCHVVR